jgi:hypothetical protein
VSGQVGEEEFRIDVYDCLVACSDRYSVRVTHLPTGISVTESGERRIETRARALTAIREKLGLPPVVTLGQQVAQLAEEVRVLRERVARLEARPQEQQEREPA